MKATLSAVLLGLAILLIAPSCEKQGQKQDQVSAAADSVRAFAESKNPELKDKPLMMTLSRRRGGGNGEVCACLQVCSESGRCTGCSCSPANCGSCAAAAELAPDDAVFAVAAEMKK